MRGFSTASGHTLGHARRLVAGLLLTGRRPVVVGALLLLIGSTVTVLATTNTPPAITSLTVSPPIANEGQTVILKGTFTDPDATDAHTLLVYWTGGDENFKEKVQLPPGQLSFQLSHTYTDNFPPTPIKVVLIDRQHPVGANDNSDGVFGGDTEFLPFQVKNVAPRFVTKTVVGTATASGVVVEGDFTDPGTSDGHQVTGAIGNPIYPPGQIPMACTLTKGERHFRCEHTHQPNLGARTYNVNLTLRDDDGGKATHTMSVHFPGIGRP